MKIAATADIHCRVDTTTLIQDLFPNLSEEADLLVLGGDLTDSGLPEEARCLEKQLRQLDLPIVAVLGNHDHESGQAYEVSEIFNNGQVCILNGNAVEIGGVGFAGTKGFAGGFGRNVVQPFGETDLKKFIYAGIEDADHLQASLARLHSRYKLVVMHYAPIVGTLEGEPHELYPFLGCSRFADAVDYTGADLIVHGHAHHGSPFGRTPGDIPVFNVSRYVLSAASDRPYRLLEVDGGWAA